MQSGLIPVLCVQHTQYTTRQLIWLHLHIHSFPETGNRRLKLTCKKGIGVMYVHSVLCFAAKPRLQYMYANCLLCIICSNVHMIGLFLSEHANNKRELAF